MNTMNPERYKSFIARIASPLLCGALWRSDGEAESPGLPGRLSAESRLRKILLTDPISLR